MWQSSIKCRKTISWQTVCTESSQFYFIDYLTIMFDRPKQIFTWPFINFLTNTLWHRFWQLWVYKHLVRIKNNRNIFKSSGLGLTSCSQKLTLYMFRHSCPNIYWNVTSFTDDLEHWIGFKTKPYLYLYITWLQILVYIFNLNTGYSKMNKMKSHGQSCKNIRIQSCVSTWTS